MRYLAPERPHHAGGEPKLLDAEGVAIAALPALYIEPIAGEVPGAVVWRVWCHLPVRSNAYRGYEVRVADGDLRELLDAWLLDPEAVLRTRFRYDFNVERDGREWGARKERPRGPVPTLADLGLG